MKKLTFAVALLLASSVCSFAQDTEEVKVKSKNLTHVPMGIDHYLSSYYYYNGKNVYNITNNAMVTASKGIQSLKVSPAGTSYLFMDVNKAKNTLRMYDLWEKDWDLGKLSTSKEFKPMAMCYSNDARVIYVMGADAKIYSFTARKLKSVDSFKVSDLVADRMEASPNGYYIVNVKGNKAEVVNLEAKNIRKAITAGGEIRSVKFSQNSKYMAVLSADGVCDVYDTKNFEVLHHYDAMGDAVACVFHDNNKYIAVVTGDTRVAIINMLNDKERHYLNAEEGSIRYVDFSKNTSDETYLFYNTDSKFVFNAVPFLSPNRQEILRNELNSRMDEWMKQMPGESLEDYNARMSDESRMKQMRIFETDIATGLAGDLLSTSAVTFGNYNPEMNMLALDFDNMPSIFLTVPQDELTEFDDPSALMFKNTQYALNENDEFELVYTEVYNKKNNQTYVFDNRERRSLSFLESGENFVSLEQLQTQRMEEMKLEEVRNQVMEAAKEDNVITDHTKIDVKTKVVPATDAAGNNILNYEVDVAYTVDQEFSARDDFGPGKYLCEESAAAKAMLSVVKKALEGDFSKYMVDGKQVKLMITGMADAIPFSRTVPYNEVYGGYEREPVYKNGQLDNITVNKKTGISQNEQLAFLRAMGVKDYIEKNIPALKKMNTSYDANIQVSDQTGSEYRRIGVKMTFVDAFKQ